MRTNFGIFDVVATAAIGILLFAGCKTSSTANSEGEQSIYGTDLKLVSEYKPLHLYIYADTAATNKFPDYAIFNGNKLVFMRENTSSNKVDTIHFENGLTLVTTERDNNGHFLRRYFDGYEGHSSQTKCFYVSTNDDGLWDYFHIYGTDTESSKSFVRSNLCWVPVF